MPLTLDHDSRRLGDHQAHRGYPFLPKQQRAMPPCAWCGNDTKHAADMIVYESERTHHSYLFCHPSCERAFVKDANDFSGD